MPISQALLDYGASITTAQALITTVHAVNPSGAYQWSLEQRQIITEAAVLRMFVSWETFLETTFLHYLNGEPSAAGNVIARFAQPPNLEHARLMVIGAARFTDWSTPEVVRRLAKLFFDTGAPFDNAIASINGVWLDFKTVRNAAAHLSSSTRGQLDALVGRRLGTGVQNATVYEFVLATDPQSSTGDTVLGTYLAQFSVAASEIANG